MTIDLESSNNILVYTLRFWRPDDIICKQLFTKMEKQRFFHFLSNLFFLCYYIGFDYSHHDHDSRFPYLVQDFSRNSWNISQTNILFPWEFLVDMKYLLKAVTYGWVPPSRSENNEVRWPKSQRETDGFGHSAQVASSQKKKKTIPRN
jgi:hypothetical protein